MLKEKIEDFIKKQFEELEEFSYDLDIEDKYVYINFTEIMGKDSKKEMTFKIIDEKLQYHSISYGWKVLDRGTNIKYFWIDLLSE
jgi:hypothetical protein